jgi:hypothetical protein
LADGAARIVPLGGAKTVLAQVAALSPTRHPYEPAHGPPACESAAPDGPSESVTPRLNS